MSEYGTYAQSWGGPPMPGIMPFCPAPVPPPVAVIEINWTAEQVREFHLKGQPYIVRANYDAIVASGLWGLERIWERHRNAYRAWVLANV